MAAKTKYRVKNWKEYNEGLKNRGNITLWVDAELEQNWRANSQKNKKEKYCIYSQAFIKMLLVLKNVYHLPYRQCIGFFEGILELLALDIPIPCYTTVCRRAKKIRVNLNSKKRKENEPIHIAFDATGLKIYGEGEWKMRIHGKSKRRKWVKLTIGVDTETGEILCQKLTDQNTHESEHFEELLNTVEGNIDTVYADGAYDQNRCYEAVEKLGAKPLFNTRKDAKIKTDPTGTPLNSPRNKNLIDINEQGEKQWKKSSGYHKRSLSENTFFRFKTIFGPKLYSRNFLSQETETQVKCAILNEMIQMAKPDAYRVEA